MRKRQGFTLVFVIVITAIMAVLVAVVTSTLARYVSTDNAQLTVTQLEAIATGFAGFHTADAVYLMRVHEMDSIIVAANASSQNSCAANWAAADVTAWRTAGPYIPFIAKSGAQSVYTPVGWINDTIIRNTRVKGTAIAQIQINGITLEDAQIIDNLVDGALSASAGTITYGSNKPVAAGQWFTDGIATNDTLSLTYSITGLANHC